LAREEPRNTLYVTVELHEDAKRTRRNIGGLAHTTRNGPAVRSYPRKKYASFTTLDRPTTLSRLLNSSRDFAAAVEYTALLLAGLVSYSRPFTDRDGSVLGPTLHEIPIFLDVAGDLGADLEIHAKIMQLSARAITGAQTAVPPAERSDGTSTLRVHRFSFPHPFGHLLLDHLDVRAFQQIANLMRLACVFTLTEIGSWNERDSLHGIKGTGSLTRVTFAE
jgi:hypothetical protein